MITTQDELLGTFSVYFREPTAPSDMSMRRLRQASALAALAVVRDRDSRWHRTLAERHRSLFVNHPDGVCEFDLERRFQRGNAALERITGYPEQDLFGRHCNEFIAPDYRELTQAAQGTLAVALESFMRTRPTITGVAAGHIGLAASSPVLLAGT